MYIKLEEPVPWRVTPRVVLAAGRMQNRAHCCPDNDNIIRYLSNRYMHMRQGTRKKVLAVLPVAGEYAKNPGHISCVENELGLRDFLEERNCEYIVTAGGGLTSNGLLDCLMLINLSLYTTVHAGTWYKDTIRYRQLRMRRNRPWPLCQTMHHLQLW